MEKAGEPSAARNYHLDAIRGLSAIVVVFNHLRESFFLDHTQETSGPFRFIYLDHYAAGLAVMIFFVLSGYLVGGGAARRVEKGRWSWSDYLLSRLTRLYIVLIPALVATALIDGIGRSHGGVSAGLFSSAFDYKSFLGSLVFMQLRLTPVFGSNGPLWSLTYEFWYYIVFPLVLLSFYAGSKTLRIFNILACVALSLSLRWVMYLFPCWLLGVGIFQLTRIWPSPSVVVRRFAFTASLLLMACALALQGGHCVTNIILMFYLDAACAGPLIWAAAVNRHSSVPSSYKIAAVFISDISYTLYLTHAPILALLKLYWLGGSRWPADGRHVLLSLVPFVLALGYAYVMYRLFEANTDEVRNWIRRLYGRTQVDSLA